MNTNFDISTKSSIMFEGQLVFIMKQAFLHCFCYLQSFNFWNVLVLIVFYNIPRFARIFKKSNQIKPIQYFRNCLKRNCCKIKDNYPLKLFKLPKLPKRPWRLDPMFAGINLLSSWISCKRALVSAPSALPFSKMLLNVLTTGRNCCLSCSVIRLVSESGKTPED